MILLGITLITAAAVVYVVTFRMNMNRRGVWPVFALNSSWVVISYIAVLAGVFSRQGAWAAALLADVVLIVALLEFVGLHRGR